MSMNISIFEYLSDYMTNNQDDLLIVDDTLIVLSENWRIKYLGLSCNQVVAFN